MTTTPMTFLLQLSLGLFSSNFLAQALIVFLGTPFFDIIVQHSLNGRQRSRGLFLGSNFVSVVFLTCFWMIILREHKTSLAA